MARLPIPGSDDGAWGDILNDYLSVAHDTDGTIKASAVDASAIQDNSVTESKLNTGSGTNGQVLTKNNAVAGGFEWTSGSGAADATTTTKGIVQLAGDLAGTATAPTVPALANKADTSTTISAGTGLTGGGDLSTNRTITANFGTTAGTIAQGNDARIVGAVQSTLVDAKGDLIAATGADAVDRLAVGGTGQTLVADSTQTSGLKWYVNSGDDSALAYGYHSATRNIGTFKADFPQNNEIWIARILVRAGYAINKIGTFIKTGGTLGAGGTNGLAIASDDGTTLLFSHDDDTFWATGGERFVSLGGAAIPAQPVDTFYRVQLCIQGYSAAPTVLLATDHQVLSDFQGMARFANATAGFQGGGGYNPLTFGSSTGGNYPLILLG